VSAPSCFNCDSAGGGCYREHEGETTWFIGLDASGQAHYACDECKGHLFNVSPLPVELPSTVELK